MVAKLALDLRYKPRGVTELPPNPLTTADDYRVTVTLDDRTTRQLYVLNRARIYTDKADSVAAINSCNTLVSGASWQYVDREQGAAVDNNIFRAGIKVRPRHYDATIFSLLTGGGGNDNYYHWFFDAIPRLHLLRLAKLQSEIGYFLVPALQFPFQLQSLECLGLNRANIISSLDTPHVSARKIILSDHPRPLHNDVNPEIPLWICNFLRDSFLQVQVRVPLGSTKIYISRKDTKRRPIVNEQELIACLEQERFTTVCLTEYSLPEQVSIFAQASVIVSGHGAGLTNLTFCQPGTRVIEIFNDQFNFASYENISRCMNLEYYRFIGASAGSPDDQGKDQSSSVSSSDFTRSNPTGVLVDIAELKRALAAIS